MPPLFIALLLITGTTAATAEEKLPLHKCSGPDKFTYWTLAPCAPGDHAIATSWYDPKKPMATQIRKSECVIKEMDEYDLTHPIKKGTARQVPPSRCK